MITVKLLAENVTPSQLIYKIYLESTQPQSSDNRSCRDALSPEKTMTKQLSFLVYNNYV